MSLPSVSAVVVAVARLISVLALLAASGCQAATSYATNSSDTVTKNRLLVVSFDAFKPSYLRLGLTPHLQAVIDGGRHSRFMRPTFPTKTFPNHFSIATGLHAGEHGVLNSKVHDWKLNRSFGYSYELFHQHDWVRPIWVSAVRYNLARFIRQ